jgi:hypothetical protein
VALPQLTSVASVATRSPSTPPPGAAGAPGRASPWWLYGFVGLQMVLQTGLLVPGLGPGRTLLRIGTFAISLGLLVAVPAGGRRYPVAPLVVLLLAVLTLGLLHPGLNTPTAGVATVVFYLAIWCPVFWVPRVAVTPLVFANVILLLWAFHTVSAAVGVLQVYDPGRFAPDPEFVKQMSGANADGLMVELADGSRVFRPAGLTDSPGGAAGSGSFAALVGVLLFGARGVVPKVLGAASVPVGLFCIYLSHVRSTLIVTALSIAGLVASLAVRGQVGRATGIAGVAGAAAVGAFAWAAAVNTGVTDRFATLLDDDPGKVYHTNRGHFLESTLTEDLPAHPLGAGLGRYGMMFVYFGTPTNPDSPPLWAEIQATAWVYDGGFLLLIAGYAAVGGAIAHAVRFTLILRDNAAAALAAVVAGYDVSVLISTAGYSTFLSQSGMMFWVLNAALYTAFAGADRR